jgi:hypothetical protein
MNEKPSRGLCCHEAGHAIVAHSFGVPVLAVHVDFTEQKGWSGCTDRPPGSTDHLDPIDQVAILIAGDVAEKVFDCHAHEDASYFDHGEICSAIALRPLRKF